MKAPASISLVRTAPTLKISDNPDDVFRRLFARNLSQVINSSLIVPDREVSKLETLAALLEVDTSNVASWLSGTGTLPDALDLNKLAKLLNVPLDELMNTGSVSGKTNHSIDDNYHRIAIHDNPSSDGHSFYALPETLRHLNLPRCSAMMTATDDSMSPLLRAGDLVIYDYRVTSVATNGIFVLKIGGEFIVRRVIKNPSLSLTLVPDNKEFPQETHEASEFTGNQEAEGRIVVVGRLVGRLSIGGF